MVYLSTLTRCREQWPGHLIMQETLSHPLLIYNDPFVCCFPWKKSAAHTLHALKQLTRVLMKVVNTLWTRTKKVFHQDTSLPVSCGNGRSRKSNDDGYDDATATPKVLKSLVESTNISLTFKSLSNEEGWKKELKRLEF